MKISTIEWLKKQLSKEEEEEKILKTITCKKQKLKSYDLAKYLFFFLRQSDMSKVSLNAKRRVDKKLTNLVIWTHDVFDYGIKRNILKEGYLSHALFHFIPNERWCYNMCNFIFCLFINFIVAHERKERSNKKQHV